MNAILFCLDRLLVMLPGLGAAIVVLLLGKLLYAMTVRYKFQEQLVHHDNPAFGVCFMGYLVGLGIAVSGSLAPSGNWMEDLTIVAVGGIVSIVLMRLGIVLNHKLLLHSFDVEKETIDDRNVGAALVVAGSSVATGLMLSGVMQGDSDPLFGYATLGMVRDMAAYWLLGQFVLVAGGAVFHLLSGFGVQKQLSQNNNVAVGLAFGGFLAAIGIIVRASLIGADSNILVESGITLIYAAAGIVLLVLVHWLSSLLFFRSSPLRKELAEDKNVAAGAISSACSIAAALLMAAAIVFHPGR